MERFIRERSDDRKYRLFGCACVRGVWDDLPEDALRQAVGICERFADDAATMDELDSAREMAKGVYRGRGDLIADHSALALTAICERQPWFPLGEGSAAGIAAVAAEAWSDDELSWDQAWSMTKREHARLLREIIGSPFRPLTLDAAWLTPEVTILAATAYVDRDPNSGRLYEHKLALLAVALEAAGCRDSLILEHCRSAGPHVRGCWVLDLLPAPADASRRPPS